MPRGGIRQPGPGKKLGRPAGPKLTPAEFDGMVEAHHVGPDASAGAKSQRAKTGRIGLRVESGSRGRIWRLEVAHSR